MMQAISATGGIGAAMNALGLTTAAPPSRLRQLSIQALALGLAIAPASTGALVTGPPIDLWSLGTGASAPRWLLPSPAVTPSLPAALSPAQTPGTRLEKVKTATGLTWSQLAEALGVEARTLHLWRRGGGIRDEHEIRLRRLQTLVATLVGADGAGGREQLLDQTNTPSLLSRLAAGEDPSTLILAAPWRAQASQQLDDNIARLDSDLPLDEQFAFLFSLDDQAVERLRADATRRLGDAHSTRSDWDRFIGDLQRVGDFHHVALDDDDLDFRDDVAPEPPALFTLDDLGLSMKVGAIGARGGHL